MPREVVAGNFDRVKSVEIVEYGRTRIRRRGFEKAPFSGCRTLFWDNNGSGGIDLAPRLQRSGKRGLHRKWALL
jgi:hypothetical protein